MLWEYLLSASSHTSFWYPLAPIRLLRVQYSTVQYSTVDDPDSTVQERPNSRIESGLDRKHFSQVQARESPNSGLLLLMNKLVVSYNELNEYHTERCKDNEFISRSGSERGGALTCDRNCQCSGTVVLRYNSIRWDDNARFVQDRCNSELHGDSVRFRVFDMFSVVQSYSSDGRISASVTRVGKTSTSAIPCSVHGRHA
jgi:hypothetical protein